MFSYFAQSLLLICRTYRGLLHSKGLGSKYSLIFRGQGQIHKICLNGLKRKLLPNILMERCLFVTLITNGVCYMTGENPVS